MKCEACNTNEATVLGVNNPLSEKLGTPIKWNYCKKCYRDEFDLLRVLLKIDAYIFERRRFESDDQRFARECGWSLQTSQTALDGQ